MGSDKSIAEQMAETRAEIAALKEAAELRELQATLAREKAALEAPRAVAAEIASAAEAISTRQTTEQTGIENLLTDPAIAEAYEAHKTKTPVGSQSEPVAAMIVQLLVIFRLERIDFTYQDKRTFLRHASSGALFLRTKSGDKGFEIVTDKGRNDLTAALMEECDLRTLSVICQEANVALAVAPKLPIGSEDSNAQASMRAAINKLKGSCKTKEEFAAAILNLLG